MKKEFVDQVEAIANLQNQSDEAKEIIDNLILKIQAIPSIEQIDKDYLIEVISNFRHKILESLARKTSYYKNL